MAEVIVRGEASGVVRADRCTIDIASVGEAATDAAATTSAAVVAARVETVIGRIDGVRRHGTGLRSGPVGRHGHDGWVETGRQARHRITIEVPATVDIGALVRDIVAAGGLIDGVSWSVDDDAAALLSLRARAVADATARAEVYCDALGARRGALLWVAEPGLRQGTGGFSYVPRSGRMEMTADLGDVAAPLELTPPDLDLEVAVEAAWAVL